MPATASRNSKPRKLSRLTLIRGSADKRERSGAGTGLVFDRDGGGGDQLDQQAARHSRRLITVDRIAGRDLRVVPVDRP